MPRTATVRAATAVQLLSLTKAALSGLLESIPGIGQIMVEAMNTRDYPLIMGGLLLSGILVLFSNLLADVAYALADPRIRY